jgi:rare lipoprotein A
MSYVLNYPGDWFVSQAGAAETPNNEGTVYTGKASWYTGKKTANGERFDPNAMAGAMTDDKVEDLPTKVTVSRGDVSIEVRINDRGPFQKGPDNKLIRPLQPHRTRVIDLIPAAFKALFGNTDIGVGDVQVRVPK